MPVGNDVVDLQDPANQPSAIHPRFDERIFSRRELLRLGEVDELDGHRLRWTLWAARESVYKYLAQREPDTPFRPAEMTVRLAGPLPGHAVGLVEWRDHAIDVRADCRPDRVHVVTLAGASPVCALRRIPETSNDAEGAAGPATDPRAISTAARALAADTVARVLDLPPGDVRVGAAGSARPSGKRAFRVPRAFRGEDVLPAELSISHDGGWIACAVVSLRRGPGAAR